MARKGQPNGEQNTVPFYPVGENKTPSHYLDRFDIYEQIRNGTFEASTNKVLKEFESVILSKAKGVDKKPYQDAKAAALSQVVFSGAVRQSEAVNLAHTGIINADIDENTKEELTALFSKIQAGQIPFIEAAARSVSGILTGAMWANFRVEIPATFARIPAAVANGLFITKDTKWNEVLTELHKAYGDFLKWLFAKEGIKIGSCDQKRARYLTHDANIYVNPTAQEISLKTLALYIEQEKANRPPAEHFNINAKDAFSYAEQYAQKHYTYENRHLYINRLSYGLNRLGVDLKDAIGYVSATYPDFKANRHKGAIHDAYKRYKDDFGTWAHKIAKECGEFVLGEGEYLTKYAHEITAAINEHKRVSLSAGMGTGKSHAIANHIAPNLTSLNGCPSVIVLPLNSKVEQEARETGLPYWTGERGKEIGSIAIFNNVVKQKLILTNQNSFPKFAAYFRAQGIKANVFIDESHLLVSSVSYKAETVEELFSCALEVGQTVTLYSGTPKPYFQELGFLGLEVKKEQQRQINLTFRNRGKDITQTAIGIILGHNFAASKLVLKIQNKKTIKALQKFLVGEGWSKNEICLLYSEPALKQSKDYKQFRDAKQGEESFAPSVKLVLCTSFVNEGVNIYSAKKTTFATVERSKFFDLDDFVQFPERWRSNQAVDFFAYVPEQEQEQPIKPFDRLGKFKGLLSEYQKEADKLNGLPPSAWINSEQVIRTKTKFSELERVIHNDTANARFVLSPLAIAYQVEQAAAKKTSLAQLVETIKARFPYFSVKTEVVTEFENEDAQTAIAEISNQAKQERGEAEQTIFELLTTSPENFKQAVAISTETSLKKSLDCSEARKKDVAEMIAANPNVFGEHLPTCERVLMAKDRLSLLSDEQQNRVIFEATKDGNIKVKSRQSVSAFLNALTLHIGLEILETTKAMKIRNKPFAALTGVQMVDVQFIEALRPKLETIAKGTDKGFLLSAEQIRETVIKQYTRHYKHPNVMTEKKAMQLFTALFVAKRVTVGNEKMYLIQGRQNVANVLASELPEMGEEKNLRIFYQNLYNSLKINTNQATTTQKKYYINGGSCGLQKPHVCPVFGVEINAFGYPASWG